MADVAIYLLIQWTQDEILTFLLVVMSLFRVELEMRSRNEGSPSQSKSRRLLSSRQWHVYLVGCRLAGEKLAASMEFVVRKVEPSLSNSSCESELMLPELCSQELDENTTRIWE